MTNLFRFLIDMGATSVAVMIAVVAFDVAIENLRMKPHD